MSTPPTTATRGSVASALIRTTSLERYKTHVTFVPPHGTQEPFTKFGIEPKVGIEQLSGEGYLTSVP